MSKPQSIEERFASDLKDLNDLKDLRPKSADEAKALWNQLLALTQGSGQSCVQQKAVCELRLACLELIENGINAESFHSKIVRTCKGFYDIQNYDKALECLGKVKLNGSSSLILQFNYYFMRGQVKFALNQEFLQEFELAGKVCEEVPNEKFRIARFLYVEVAGKLLAAKKFVELSKVCLVIDEISKLSNCESLKEINKESRILMAESLIETGSYEKAKKIIDCVEKNETSALIYFKWMIYSGTYEDLNVLFQEMVAGMALESLRKAVDIMICRGKNLDCCKLLKAIAGKYEEFWVYFIWFKILFALELVGMLDTQYDFLNIHSVLLHLKQFPDPEYLNLLWDYIQEIFHKCNYQEALQMTFSFYLPQATPCSKQEAGLMIAKCLLNLNQVQESFQYLENFHLNLQIDLNQVSNFSQLNGLKCICLIRLKKLGPGFEGLLPTLAYSELVLVLQELAACDDGVLQEVLKEFYEVLLGNLESEEDKVRILMWLVENDSDCGRLTRYFSAVKSTDVKDYEFFAVAAWNFALDQERIDDRICFMAQAVEFAEKVQVFNAKIVDIIKNTCKFALLYHFRSYYDSLFKVFKLIPKDLKDFEYVLVLFEFSLIFNEIDQNFFSDSLENMMKMAKICKKHCRFDVAKEFLIKIIQIKPDHESIKELLGISSSLEDLEEFLSIAERFYSRSNDGGETDWIIAYCWNNAVTHENTLRSAISKIWLKCALSVSRSCKSRFLEKVERLYNKIIPQEF